MCPINIDQSTCWICVGNGEIQWSHTIRITKLIQHLGDAKLQPGESGENVYRTRWVRTTARRHVERGAFAPEEQGQREGPEMEQDHNRIIKKNFWRRKGLLGNRGENLRCRFTLAQCCSSANWETFAFAVASLNLLCTWNRHSCCFVLVKSNIILWKIQFNLKQDHKVMLKVIFRVFGAYLEAFRLVFLPLVMKVIWLVKLQLSGCRWQLGDETQTFYRNLRSCKIHNSSTLCVLSLIENK